MARLNRKRLSMDMPIKMHDELKKLAHKHNITLTMYVLRALSREINKEKSYENIRTT